MCMANDARSKGSGDAVFIADQRDLSAHTSLDTQPAQNERAQQRLRSASTVRAQPFTRARKLAGGLAFQKRHAQQPPGPTTRTYTVTGALGGSATRHMRPRSGRHFLYRKCVADQTPEKGLGGSGTNTAVA